MTDQEYLDDLLAGTPFEEPPLLRKKRAAQSAQSERPAYQPWEEDDSPPAYQPWAEDIPPPTDADAPPEDPDEDPLVYRVPPDAPTQDAPTAPACSLYPDAPPHTDEEIGDPLWVIHKKTGDEVSAGPFVEYFAYQHGIICVNGRFYMGDEAVTDDRLKYMIYQEIKPVVAITAQRVSAILALLAIETERMPPAVLPNCISFKNCSLLLMQREDAPRTPENIILRKLQPQPVCLCRVPHNFNPNVGEPTRFLDFLHGLFYADDIPTLQQYLGHCLMPSTKAQKALFVIGKGGEGKSRLTMLMKNVLGSTCVVSSISRVGERFFGTVLENHLLFIDDDLCCDKFHATDSFKTLVTNETAVAVEPKGKAIYETRHYARFFLMGNQSVGSLHDRSEGFYRRVHIINTKPIDKTRPHNPFIMEDIWAAEQQEILLWLVKGALQLARQNYVLSESAAARAELKALRQSDNTALEFLQEQRFVYGEGCSVTSQQLAAKYKEWCFDNDLFKVSGQVFKQTCDVYFEGKEVTYSKSIAVGARAARGYKGVCCEY